MQLDFAFICDYADQLGKIVAVGVGIEEIRATEVPATHKQLALVARIRTNVTETGTKNMTLDMIDSDGVSVLPPIEMQIEVEHPEGQAEGTLTLVGSINDVSFPHYGAYSIHIGIDGHELARLPLRVVPVPETA